MNLELLPLAESDLARTTEIAQASLIYDPISEIVVREKIWSEPSYDAELAFKAVVDGTQVGFLAGHVDERRDVRRGYIKFFAVDAAHRERGIGSAMLARFEELAKQRDALAVRTMDSIPNYLAPGIDPRYTPATLLFQRRGYEQVDETIDLVADLDKADLDTAALEAAIRDRGLVTRRAEPRDRDSLSDLLERFWKTWKYECDLCYQNDPISLFLGLDGEKVVAFAAYDANNQGVGWFGPMGTDPEYRGHKLGEITLKQCLAAIKAQGLKTSVIPWVGPIGFYSRTVGAAIDRLFWVFEKKL